MPETALDQISGAVGLRTDIDLESEEFNRRFRVARRAAATCRRAPESCPVDAEPATPDAGITAVDDPVSSVHASCSTGRGVRPGGRAWHGSVGHPVASSTDARRRAGYSRGVPTDRLAVNAGSGGRIDARGAWCWHRSTASSTDDRSPNRETVEGYATQSRATRAPAAARPVSPRSRPSRTGSSAGTFAVAEAYPDLKASTNFLELQRELTETEDRIAAGRRFYNANVRALNTRVESFPSNSWRAASASTRRSTSRSRTRRSVPRRRSTSAEPVSLRVDDPRALRGSS